MNMEAAKRVGVPERDVPTLVLFIGQLNQSAPLILACLRLKADDLDACIEIGFVERPALHVCECGEAMLNWRQAPVVVARTDDGAGACCGGAVVEEELACEVGVPSCDTLNMLQFNGGLECKHRQAGKPGPEDLDGDAASVVVQNCMHLRSTALAVTVKCADQD